MIFHMTTGEGVRELRLTPERGQEAYGEVCPQCLLIDDAERDVALSPEVLHSNKAATA